VSLLRHLGDCGEKLTLSISIFVALQVFYLLLIDLIPPTSLTISLLGTYLLFTLVLVNASIFITILTLNIHWRHPNTHHMPNWVKRWFFQIIPPFIFMSKPHIANAILQSNDDDEKDEPSNKNDPNIKRLNNYLQAIPIDRYPPVIQQAVRDIRYISETQRESQKDDLVRSIRRLNFFLIGLLCFVLGKRRLAIHRACHRSMLSHSIHHFDCHGFVHYFTFSSVHTK
jgi:hypothetical protein